MPLPLEITHFAGAAEAAYADSTLAGLSGSDILPIDEGGTFSYKQEKKQRTHASGGFRGGKGAAGASWCELGNIMVDMVPITVSAALSERPTIDPFLLSSKYHVTTENNVGASEYRIKYRLNAHLHPSQATSMAAIAQMLAEDNATALEYAIKGIRFNAGFKLDPSEIIKGSFAGGGLCPAAPAHQGTPATPGSFPAGNAIVHKAASVIMTAKAAAGDVTFAGEMTSFEIISNFRIDYKKVGGASNGVARVVLTPQRPQVKIGWVLETMNAWKVYDYQKEPAILEFTSRWTSVDSSNDHIEALTSIDVSDNGVEITKDSSGEAEVICTGDMAWGIPGESHVNPLLSGIEWRFLTTY